VRKTDAAKGQSANSNKVEGGEKQICARKRSGQVANLRKVLEIEVGGCRAKNSTGG